MCLTGSVPNAVRPERVFPVPKTTRAQIKSGLEAGPIMDGKLKPARNGRYLRYFSDVDDWAFSEFKRGVWLRDGFWRSEIQDAPWRGGVAK